MNNNYLRLLFLRKCDIRFIEKQKFGVATVLRPPFSNFARINNI